MDRVKFIFLGSIVLLLLTTGNAFATCDSSLPATGTRDDVFIIVNDNSIDSCGVGTYYAQQRGIGRNNIIHVSAPVSFFITWTEFKIMRDQIITFMRANTFKDSSIVPVVCPATSESAVYCQESMDQLRAQTKVNYIITTKGVPSRVVVDGSTLPFKTAPTSIDNYLRHWLVNYYARDVVFNSNIRASAFGDGQTLRTVNPAIDGELIIGRLDGLDATAAKRLVDRAITAEKNGIYGKHYGSKFGSTGGRAVWLNYAVSGQYNYGDAATGWQYQHGIFGGLENQIDLTMNAIRFDQNINCLTHIDSSAATAAGKSPQECVVKLTRGADAVIGKPNSRQPLVDNALVYLGSLDGQPTNGSFTGFMNWRKDTSCAVTLCKNTSDPALCELNSTDTFKEINTQCAGVADGFIGYNFQSYPVAFMAAWPTSWYQTTASDIEQWLHQGGGDLNKLAFPQVISGDSADADGNSVWFKNSDEVANAQCFSDLSLTTQGNCTNDRRLYAFVNKTEFTTKTSDLLQLDQYRISFKYKVTNFKASPAAQLRFRVGVFLKEPEYNFFQVNYGLKTFNLVGDTNAHIIPEGNSAWVEVETFVTLDPAKHATARSACLNDTTGKRKCFERVAASFLDTPWSGTYDGVKIRLETTGKFSGELGIDDVQIQQVNATTQSFTLNNGGFTLGHEQVAAGDHAANFLSRLNGTAFWGSMSHHQSGGHSFDKHPLETLIYFMRGLPLGDAVWFAENYNSGVLYGDPLYSPAAIKFNKLNTYNFVLDSAALVADTVNGNDSTIVTTTFAVDYCAGNDFFICDQQATWISTGLSGTGGQQDTNLGVWDATAITAGQYTLRLAVTSNNSVNTKSQTFYDYYPVVVANQTSDFDGDGVSDAIELAAGMNPTSTDSDNDGLSDSAELAAGTDPIASDSDGDGVSDGDEVLKFGTDPLNADTDGDLMPDGWELTYAGLDPLVDDAALDPDLDNLINLDEFKAGTNPIRPDTDRDGINDGEEVANATDPTIRTDTDLDGMSDDWETIRGTRVNRDDARFDADQDGVDNIIEFIYRTLPLDNTSTPLVKTVYVDAINGNDATGDGSITSPFASFSAGYNAAAIGDTVQLASGSYGVVNFLQLNKMVAIKGQADRSVTLTLPFLYATFSRWLSFSDMKLNVNSIAYVSNTRNLLFRNVELGLKVSLTMTANTKVSFERVLVTNNGTATAIVAKDVATDNRTELNIRNSTIAGFTLGVDWNGSYFLRVVNTIMANTSDLQDIFGYQVRNSLLNDAALATNFSNLVGDAKFVDAANGDYHVLPASPAVDTGSPFYRAINEPVGHRLNIGFYSNTAEATTAIDTDGDGMPDGWETAVGLNPLLADNTIDSDNDGVVNALEYRFATQPLISGSRRNLRYTFLNPNFTSSTVEAMALVDGSYINGTKFVRLDQFETTSFDMTTFDQRRPFSSNKPIAFASDVDGTDMPVVNWMSGYDFVIPNYRQDHTYYLTSLFGTTRVTVTTDTTQTYIVHRGRTTIIAAGSLNTLSAIIHAESPIVVSHSAKLSSGVLIDNYVVPPASKEVTGIKTRNIILGALQDNTHITLYYSDGSQQVVLLNSGGRHLITSDNTSAQGQGEAVRIIADKPIAAIQGADSDGIEATAFWDPIFFARRYGFPINTQYIAVACHETAVINLYDQGAVVDTQTCTATGNTPGKAYFGAASSGINISAGQYIISDKPIYIIYESSSNNDEKNILGAL